MIVRIVTIFTAFPTGRLLGTVPCSESWAAPPCVSCTWEAGSTWELAGTRGPGHGAHH